MSEPLEQEDSFNKCGNIFDPRNFGQLHLAGFPLRGEVIDALVVEVSDIIEGDEVALDFRPGSFGHVR